MANLARNASCKRMLALFGDNTPNEERVLGSWRLRKINKRCRRQERVLLLTDKALYNVKPRQLSKCQRRIDLKLVESISIAPAAPSASHEADEFIIHVPLQYDYRFESSWKNCIVSIISGTCTKAQGQLVKVKTLEVAMEDAAFTKKQGKLSPQQKRQMIVLRQRPSIMPRDAFECRAGNMSSLQTMQRMFMSIAKAKSYALRLDKCVAFCVESKRQLDWNQEYYVDFKEGELKIEQYEHWNTFVVGLCAQRRW